MRKRYLQSRFVAHAVILVLLSVFLASCLNNQSKFLGTWEWQRTEHENKPPLAILRILTFHKNGNMDIMFSVQSSKHFRNETVKFKISTTLFTGSLLKGTLSKGGSKLAVYFTPESKPVLFSYEFTGPNTLVLTDAQNKKHFYKRTLLTPIRKQQPEAQGKDKDAPKAPNE